MTIQQVARWAVGNTLTWTLDPIVWTYRITAVLSGPSYLGDLSAFDGTNTYTVPNAPLTEAELIGYGATLAVGINISGMMNLMITMMIVMMMMKMMAGMMKKV